MSRLLSSLSFRILIVRFQRQLIPMFHSFPNDAIPFLSSLTPAGVTLILFRVEDVYFDI